MSVEDMYENFQCLYNEEGWRRWENCLSIERKLNQAFRRLSLSFPLGEFKEGGWIVCLKAAIGEVCPENKFIREWRWAVGDAIFNGGERGFEFGFEWRT